VVVVREISMLPVEDASPSWIQVSMWVGAAALLGLTYFLVRLGQSYMKEKQVAGSPAAHVGNSNAAS
jgi:hypothetical protein